MTERELTEAWVSAWLCISLPTLALWLAENLEETCLAHRMYRAAIYQTCSK